MVSCYILFCHGHCQTTFDESFSVSVYVQFIGFVAYIYSSEMVHCGKCGLCEERACFIIKFFPTHDVVRSPRMQALLKEG